MIFKKFRVVARTWIREEPALTDLICFCHQRMNRMKLSFPSWLAVKPIFRSWKTLSAAFSLRVPRQQREVIQHLKQIGLQHHSWLSNGCAMCLV